MMGKYLRARKILFLFYTLSVGLISSYLWLVHTNSSDIWYCLLLVTAIFLLLIAFDMGSFFRQYRELERILDNLSDFAQAIPLGNNCIEQTYAEISEGLQIRAQQKAEQTQQNYQATLDYYTQWVHQIKTPIAALQLILQEPVFSPALAQQELFQIQRYVDMALQYVKSADLSQDLVLTSVDIEPLVRESLKKYAPLFIRKNLQAQVTPFTLQVVTDAKWFRFLFEQLLSNAVKYTKTGGVFIYKQEGALVLQDTGLGIRPEDLPRVFEKGYTGYNGRLDQRASGIGLFLSKRIANVLGIHLQIQSKPGQGTTVQIYFPQNPPTIVE